MVVAGTEITKCRAEGSPRGTEPATFINPVS